MLDYLARDSDSIRHCRRSCPLALAMTEDSFSVPASGPTINKIPFLVFDAVLVITAVTLAFSTDSPLAPAVFFWILLCVVVGGVVGCLPFWIEFRDRVRLSEYEFREQQNSLHDSQWQYVDARLGEQNEFLNKLHLRLSDVGDRLASLETRPPFPSASEVAVLCGSALQKQWPDWREELLTTLSRRTDLLFNEQNAQSAKLSAVHEKRLGELRKEFYAVETVLRGLDSRVNEIALFSAGLAGGQGAQQAVAEGFTKSQGIAAAADAKSAAAAESVLSAANNGLSAEPVNREPAEVESTIVEPADAKLIDAEPGGTELSDTEPGDTESAGEKSALSDKSATQPPATPTTAVEESTAQAAETLAAPDTELVPDAETHAAFELEASEAATAGDVAEAGDVEAAAADEAGDLAEAGSTPLADAEPTPPSAAAQPVPLQTPPAAAAKGSGAKTTLVAQVLIGIGNKPYVRGIGPGLSMDKGVPMQFVEIGKWEWVSPNGHEPIKIQIYKNDEIPSSLGEIEIAAGQRRAVTPIFPR